MRSTCAHLIVVGVLPFGIQAGETVLETGNFRTHDTPTGDCAGVRTGLPDQGVSIELTTTGYDSGLLAPDPFLGGRARDRFTSIAFVAPPGGVVPPTIMGAIISRKWEPCSLTFMAFDPNDQTNEHRVDKLFGGGANLLLAASRAGEIAERPGSLGLTATCTTTLP